MADVSYVARPAENGDFPKKKVTVLSGAEDLRLSRRLAGRPEAACSEERGVRCRQSVELATATTVWEVGIKKTE